jgi:phenylacetate-CoA ligase
MRRADALGRIPDVARALVLSRRLLTHDRWTDAELRAHQRRALTDLVRHAKRYSAFYRELYEHVDSGGEVELEQLPAIDKATMMSSFDRVVTDPRLRLSELEAHLDGLAHDERYLGEYRVMATGGSTGRKGVFVVDQTEWRHYLAAFFRLNEYMGVRPRFPRRLKLAAIAAPRPQHMTNRMSASVDVGLHRVLRLDASAPAETLVAPLNRHRPDFLYGYPSILGLLAVEQLEGRLRIAPAIIASSGETYTEETASAIREAWDVPWFEIYGTTENGILGSHCPAREGLHLMEDTTIVEIVDEHDRPVPPGCCGHKLLVTNLVNRVQPLIRYAISDMVSATGEPCPCGRPFRVLADIQGRNDDILHLPAAAGGEIPVHPLAVRSPLAAVPGLKQYRITQTVGGLQVRAALRTGAARGPIVSAIEHGLRAKLAGLGVEPLEIAVDLVDHIDGGRDTAGKFKLVVAQPDRLEPSVGQEHP